MSVQQKHIDINFVDVEVKYTPYDEDGNVEAVIAVGFDTAANVKHQASSIKLYFLVYKIVQFLCCFFAHAHADEYKS